MIRLLEMFRDEKVRKLLSFFFSNERIPEIIYINNKATDK